MNLNNRKNLIFDFDGTIVDSLDLLVDIYNKICFRYNCFPVDMSDKKELMNKRPQEFLKKYRINYFKLPIIALGVKKEFKKRVKDVKIFPGISQSLWALKEKGFNLFILTSNSKKVVGLFLKNNNLESLFDSVYSSSNVFGKDKSIRRFLRDSKMFKEEVIYIGDETRDVEAMRRAGIPIFSVGWGFNSKESLLKLNPDKFFDKPEDLISLN